MDKLVHDCIHSYMDVVLNKKVPTYKKQQRNGYTHEWGPNESPRYGEWRS
eukprot:COSAG01_NODE_61164_length_290_cov_128.251309_1_plen_49_part_01